VTDALAVELASPERAAPQMLYVVLGTFIATGLAIGALIWFGEAPERKGFQLCDEAIKSTLKAPSTYRRVEGKGTYHVSGSAYYSIEYDAQNSFGVPLRGHGSCQVNVDQTAAKWVEYPSP
jgi:hypothetical protein